MTAPTNEQTIILWALECDLIDSRDIKEEFAQSILAKLLEFTAIAYAAGQSAEREACAKTCEDYADITSDHDAHHAYKCAYIIRKRGGDENIS